MYSYTIAKTDTDKKNALSLVREIYAKEGYVSDSNSNPFEVFIISPKTKTFTGLVNGITFATASVVLDSQQGLPMDSLYKEELDNFRKNKKVIAEATQYAVEQDILKKEDPEASSMVQFMATKSLWTLILHYAFFAKIDYLCIAINPKHVPFYTSVGFKEIGGLKYYSSVNNAPAVAVALDIEDFKKKDLPGILSDLFSNPPDYKIFTD